MDKQTPVNYYKKNDDSRSQRLRYSREKKQKESFLERLDLECSENGISDGGDAKSVTPVIKHPAITFDSLLNENPNLCKKTYQNSSNTIHDEDYELEVEYSKERRENPFPNGRFLCNLSSVIKQAREVESHSYACNFGGRLIYDKLTKNGLVYSLNFICSNPACGKNYKILTDNDGDSLNELAVLGALSTGCGFSQEEEKFSIMNMQYLSGYKFSQVEKKIGDVVKACAQDSMEEAIREEKKYADSSSNKDENGYYNITAIIDGGWCKRSYGRGYNASSGVAVIVGLKSRKILFIGIRNKICIICRYISQGKIAVKSHVCFKNWKNSSTGMESDIIVEGLNFLSDIYKVRCMRLVGDGDSSTMCKIKERVSFGNSVLKIECANHAVRRFRRALEKVHLTSPSLHGAEALRARKTLKAKIPFLVNMARAVIRRHTVSADTEPSKDVLNNFITHLQNIPLHVLGNHSMCDDFFQSCEKYQRADLGKLSSLELEKIVILELNKTLVSCSNTLIFNLTNNAAESFMSGLCKTYGGKRIDFSRAGGINRRANIATLSFQSPAQEWILKVQEAITNKSPQTPTRKFASARMKRHLRRKLFPAKRIKPDCIPHGGDEDYGEYSQKPDIHPEIYLRLSEEFLNNLKVTKSDDLEFITRNQHASEKWRAERSKRISSSYFKDVADRRLATTSNLVKRVVYNKPIQVAATNYGLANESFALNQYMSETGNEVEHCGLFIDVENPFLCTSPDGLVGPEGLVEIKCPYSARNSPNFEAVACKSNIGLKFKCTGEPFLPVNHRYYYQIQGQLAITGRKWCDLYFWCKADTKIIRIEKDPAFWQKIVPKLKKFYLDCVLPELIDPRLNRNLPLREPYVKNLKSKNISV